MVFVTMGSQKFQFDRLLRAVDELAGSGAIPEPVFAQVGACTYEPKNIEWAAFIDRDEFKCRMAAADVAITHGGTGAIIGAVKAGKKVVAVPRLACHGEHVDDHQVEIVRQFADMGLIEPCMDVADLGAAYAKAKRSSYRSYVSNTDAFVADLRAYLETIGSK
ncbi:MAG: glycosyltransferase [Coriobacteriaceae bacterium]|nr:glycosyltransferase [Coriobacteriaceae bacterium]